MSFYEESPLTDLYGRSHPFLCWVAAIIYTNIRQKIVCFDSLIFSSFCYGQVSPPFYYKVALIQPGHYISDEEIGR